MQAFVHGLKEPLGSRIRCMRPDSVEKALEFVQEELNVMYLQSRNDNFNDRKSNSLQNALPKPMQLQPFSMPVQKTFIPHAPVPFNFNAPQRSQFVPQQTQQLWRPNFSMNRPPQFPSRTQQMFRALPQNYNAQHNAFRMPPRPQFQSTGPKPMSGVSHFITKPLPPTISGHDWTKFGNPPPNNYFKTREANLNECYSDDAYYYQDYEHSYYPDYEYNTCYGYPSSYDCDPAHYPDDQILNEQTDETDDPQTSTSNKDFQRDRTLQKPK